mmetsp:Transcript_10300/g.23064  ORF Transcript_10300/g.23064 Transcript_10300/m.23064 type:complete len:412 (-) Transcript_10300:135-1370(-)
MVRVIAAVALAAHAAIRGLDPCENVTVQSPELKKGTVQDILLVTGGSGFIGSHLVELLLSLGYHVRVLDSLFSGNIQYLPLQHPNLELIYGDISDRDTVYGAMKGVEGVFHLAACSKVAPSLKDPRTATLNFEKNVVGTALVLEAAHKFKVHKVVYTASSTFYGNQPVPFHEDLPHSPTSPYAISKKQGEELMTMYHTLYDVRTVSLRLFMVYGPRQPRTGAYAVVNGKFILMKQQGLPLTIEGDGTQFRDFVHVKDVARALVLAMDSNVKGESINVGSGQGHSVNDLADMVSDKRVTIPRRSVDLDGTLANTCKAKKLLNFGVEYSFVDTMQGFVANPDSADPLAGFWEEASTVSHLDHQIMDRVDGQFFVWSNMTVEHKMERLRAALDKEPKFLSNVLRAISEGRRQEL